MPEAAKKRNEDKVIGSLKSLLAQDGIVLLAGAGLSLSASGAKIDSVASWLGLLHNGIERCRQIDPKSIPKWIDYVLRDKESAEDYILLLAVAEKITNILKSKAGEYSRWLEDTVGKLKVSNRDLFKSLRQLEIRIMTTNYDDLIEEGLGGWRAVTWLQQEEVTRWMNAVDKAVLHLHGYWRDSMSVVLGVRSYDFVISNQQIQNQLRALWLTKSFLFVGFGKGLGDPNFGALLAWARSLFPNAPSRHFRLVTDEEFTTVSEQHVGDPITVIPYGKHADLANFLANLKNGSHAHFSSDRFVAPSNGGHPNGSLSLEEVVRAVFGLDEAQLTQTLRAQFRSIVYGLVARSFYSAGNKDATQRLSIKNHCSVFYQGREGLLKLQVFDFPAGAKQIQAAALGKNPDGDYEVRSWLMLKSANGKVTLIPPTWRDNEQYYSIDTASSRSLCIITFYKDYSAFYGGNEQIWLEVDGLCGNISQMEVLFGGKLKSMRFTAAYFLQPTDPVRFDPVPDGQTLRHPKILNRSAIRRDVQPEFEPFIESGLLQAVASQPAKKAVSLWNQIVNGAHDSWGKIQFSDVKHNLLLAASGQYRPASRKG